MGRHEPIINISPDRVLIDRRTLAHITQRPVPTIRARCTVVDYSTDRRALYDLDQAQAVLAVTPPRGHRIVPLET
ncbi:hypothetical protein [Lentzea kentuckyensis]|uniref:hypothetical protein n=1 Tax=Lentzea kentuckyensis TaxID=360086 RepID=UPI000A36B5DC|nr:hypothetical protein [Lentzea kentuckyensis]